MTGSFGMDAYELKRQTAKRRAVSLSKDRAAYSRHIDEKKVRASSQKAIDRKTASAQKCSDIVAPHRMARTATRSCLAKGMIESGCDMPQISVDHSTWKPAVSGMLCYAAAEQEQSHDLTPEKFQDTILKIEEVGREVLEAQVFANAAKKECLEIVRCRASDSKIAAGAKSPLESEAALEQASSSSTLDSGAVEEHQKSPTLKNASCAPFDSKLDDDMDFPPLATCSQKTKSCVTLELTFKAPTQSSMWPVCLPDASFTPEKTCKPTSSVQETQEEKATDDLKDWVVLAPGKKVHTPKVDSFGSTHPRSIFAMFSKKVTRAPNVTQSKAVDRDGELDIDWSQCGIPTEVKKQIIHGSMDAAHRGPHAKQQARAVPLNALRAQSREKSRRQSSVPKTPRSQSKPRSSQQMKGRR